VRTGRGPDPKAREEYAALVDTWRLRTKLAELLGSAVVEPVETGADGPPR
jgi:hypothetical protein